MIYESVQVLLILVQRKIHTPDFTPEHEEEVEKAILDVIGIMRRVIIGARILPLSWAIHQDHFPKQFHKALDGLPTVKFGPGHCSSTHNDLNIEFPVFSELAAESLVTGEEGVQRVV
jgi:hypothetical protein